ncbi:hypothetical protein [Spirosoma pulveris]
MKQQPVIDQLKHETKAVQGEASKDKTYSSQNTFADAATAREAFARSVEKLLNVTAWSGLSDLAADFSLYNAVGREKPNEPVQPGDYIKIQLPGPTPENWVRVTDVTSRETCVQFTVQPSHDPGSSRPEQTEHFFSEQARSTFQVELLGNTIRAAEIGQDESINNQQPEAGSLGRALVNTVIAEGGWLFYQKFQWKLLTDYLVHLE